MAWRWILEHPVVVAAASTVLLALFAAVQLIVEGWRSSRARQASAVQALGWAWLARRNCEAAIRQALNEESAYAWHETVSQKAALDEMQSHMLRMLSAASLAKGRIATDGREAFSAFLAFADRVTDPKPYALASSSIDAYGSPVPTRDERAVANRTVSEAIDHLICAVTALERIAPRGAHERASANRDKLPLLNPIGDDGIPVGDRG